MTSTSEGMSPEAERLRNRLWSSALSEDVTPGSITLAIVVELGVTQELVEALNIKLGTRAHSQAAKALSTLLEVAGNG